MSKINRRDYLIQMSAASAFVGMSSLLSPSLASAEMKHGQSAVREKAARTRFLFTPYTTTPPSATNLTVLFGGLMGFSNTNAGQAQVGFQKGSGKHKLAINFYEIIGGGTRCYKLPSITSRDLAGVKTMELTVRDQATNVNFFHKNDFERKPTDDPRDFGWVLDFEDSLLYPDGVTITTRFSPVLKLNQGTLYTHQLTNSKFNLIYVPQNTLKYVLNYVPRMIGAAIDIPSGKEVILKLDGKSAVQLPYIPGVRYEIQFMNDCYDSSGDHCKWPKPKDPNEKIRNDFYLHYNMFKPKNGSARKCGVIVDQEITGSPLQVCPPPMKLGSDEAPCMASGFGMQTGF